jgi:hypothetical protein
MVNPISPAPITGSKHVNSNLRQKMRNEIKERKSRFKDSELDQQIKRSLIKDLAPPSMLSGKGGRMHRESNKESTKNSTRIQRKTPGFSFTMILPTSSMMTSEKPDNYESIVELSYHEIDDEEFSQEDFMSAKELMHRHSFVNKSDIGEQGKEYRKTSIFNKEALS